MRRPPGMLYRRSSGLVHESVWAENECMVIEFKSGKATLRPRGADVDISASATVALMRDGNQIVAMLGPDLNKKRASACSFLEAARVLRDGPAEHGRSPDKIGKHDASSIAIDVLFFIRGLRSGGRPQYGHYRRRRRLSNGGRVD